MFLRWISQTHMLRMLFVYPGLKDRIPHSMSFEKLSENEGFQRFEDFYTVTISIRPSIRLVHRVIVSINEQQNEPT